MNSLVMFPNSRGLLPTPQPGLLYTPYFQYQQLSVTVLPTNRIVHQIAPKQLLSPKCTRSKDGRNRIIHQIAPKQILPPKCTRNKDERLSLDGVYMIIHNIPMNFKHVDLRSFFSQFIESSGFSCFHYMFRPEYQIGEKKCLTTCCFIKVDPKCTSEFIEKYNGVHWTNKTGETQATQCSVKKIIIDDSIPTVEELIPRKRKRSKSKFRVDRDTFHSKDIDTFKEYHPPCNMPQGNIGTTIKQFEKLKKAGRLSTKIMNKLGLVFPDESDPPKQDKKLSEVKVSHNVTAEERKMQKEKKKKERRRGKKEKQRLKKKRETVLLNLGYWVDTIHIIPSTARTRKLSAAGGDDLLNQKSISGENCNEAENCNIAEKYEVVHLHEFAGFDKYSNGFGRRFLEAQGWKQGEGIGKNGSGMSEPIMYAGQKPTVKRGLGYQGKKNSQPKKALTDSDKSDAPPSASTVQSVTRSENLVSTLKSNFKLNYQKEFVKGIVSLNK